MIHFFAHFLFLTANRCHTRRLVSFNCHMICGVNWPTSWTMINSGLSESCPLIAALDVIESACLVITIYLMTFFQFLLLINADQALKFNTNDDSDLLSISLKCSFKLFILGSPYLIPPSSEVDFNYILQIPIPTITRNPYILHWLPLFSPGGPSSLSIHYY